MRESHLVEFALPNCLSLTKANIFDFLYGTKVSADSALLFSRVDFSNCVFSIHPNHHLFLVSGRNVSFAFNIWLFVTLFARDLWYQGISGSNGIGEARRIGQAVYGTHIVYGLLSLIMHFERHFVGKNSILNGFCL